MKFRWVRISFLGTGKFQTFSGFESYVHGIVGSFFQILLKWPKSHFQTRKAIVFFISHHVVKPVVKFSCQNRLNARPIVTSVIVVTSTPVYSTAPSEYSLCQNLHAINKLHTHCPLYNLPLGLEHTFMLHRTFVFFCLKTIRDFDTLELI